MCGVYVCITKKYVVWLSVENSFGTVSTLYMYRVLPSKGSQHFKHFNQWLSHFYILPTTRCVLFYLNTSSANPISLKKQKWRPWWRTTSLAPRCTAADDRECQTSATAANERRVLQLPNTEIPVRHQHPTCSRHPPASTPDVYSGGTCDVSIS